MMVPLLLARNPIHMGLEMADRLLHRLGRLQYERQLHLARAEQLTNDLHAVQEERIDDDERVVLAQRVVQVLFQALAVAVDDALF